MYKNSKLYAILSYITWIGFIIALIARDKNDPLVRRHLNHALVIWLAETIAGFLTRFGGIFIWISSVVGICGLVFTIWGIIRAAQMNEEPLPLIGSIELIH